ncbi:MAG: RNA polymerase sigma factor [Anaerolineales bacterium]|jgi:RNA polymerase sigma-70 factor (ECF subfamily)
MQDIDQLLTEIAPDDPQLAEALVHTYGAYLERFAAAYLGDPAEADDAVQETFIRAARSLHRYQPGSNLRAWLTAICANVCKGRRRRRKTATRLQQSLERVRLAFADPSPEETLLAQESQDQLRAALQALDDRHRLVVILRYLQGLPVRDIAQILEIPEGTVHSRLHHAHHQLRGALLAAGWDSEGGVQ